MMQILASILAISPDEWDLQGDGPQGEEESEAGPRQEAGTDGSAGPVLQEVAQCHFQPVM